MIKYAPPVAPRPYVPARLGQAAEPPISKNKAAVVMSVLTVFGAGVAWVGISTGLRERGILSVAGWGVGIAGGLLGVLGLTCLINLATGRWEPGATVKAPAPR